MGPVVLGAQKKTALLIAYHVDPEATLSPTPSACHLQVGIVQFYAPSGQHLRSLLLACKSSEFLHPGISISMLET